MNTSSLIFVFFFFLFPLHFFLTSLCSAMQLLSVCNYLFICYALCYSRYLFFSRPLSLSLGLAFFRLVYRFIAISNFYYSFLTPWHIFHGSLSFPLFLLTIQDFFNWLQNLLFRRWWTIFTNLFVPNYWKIEGKFTQKSFLEYRKKSIASEKFENFNISRCFLTIQDFFN